MVVELPPVGHLGHVVVADEIAQGNTAQRMRQYKLQHSTGLQGVSANHQ